MHAMNAPVALPVKLHVATMSGFASAGYACQGSGVDYIVPQIPGDYRKLGGRCVQSQGVDCLCPDPGPGTARLDCLDDCHPVDSLAVFPAHMSAHRGGHYHK